MKVCECGWPERPCRADPEPLCVVDGGIGFMPPTDHPEPNFQDLLDHIDTL